MKTFNEYLESKLSRRVIKTFPEMMYLIVSNNITRKNLFEIAGYKYRLSNPLLSYNYLENLSGRNDIIFEKLIIDQKAVAYRLYEDTTCINYKLYPESTNVQDCLKLMAYCYAVHEELIINAPLLIEQSIEQFNTLYDEYLLDNSPETLNSKIYEKLQKAH